MDSSILHLYKSINMSKITFRIRRILKEFTV